MHLKDPPDRSKFATPKHPGWDRWGDTVRTVDNRITAENRTRSGIPRELLLHQPRGYRPSGYSRMHMHRKGGGIIHSIEWDEADTCPVQVGMLLFKSIQEKKESSASSIADQGLLLYFSRSVKGPGSRNISSLPLHVSAGVETLDLDF